MKILLELQSSKLKLTQFSRKLGIATAEASRHLQRLNEDHLIKKNTNGSYQLTQIGEIILVLMSNIRFIVDKKELFLQYDLSGLPYEFINRIGELEKSEYIDETFKNLELAQDYFREAKEFIWILSDHILKTAIPIIQEKLRDKNFENRIILPETVMPPSHEALISSTLPGVKKRTLPHVGIIILVTETYACLAVPTLNGKMDYTGFVSTDDKFRKWCTDVFRYYWYKAKPFGTRK